MARITGVPPPTPRRWIAYRFTRPRFARARWQPGDLGRALARLVVKLLAPGGCRRRSW